MLIIKSSTKAPPAIAAITVDKLPIIIPPALANTIIATPKLEPAVIPSTEGPAKGFLKSACIWIPAKAKPEPAKIAVVASIKRDSTITGHVSLPASPPNRIDITAEKGISTEPVTKAIQNKIGRRRMTKRYLIFD